MFLPTWLRSLRSSFNRKTSRAKGARRRRPKAFRPGLEHLEERAVPAIYTVNSSAYDNARDDVLTLKEVNYLFNSLLTTPALTAAEQAQIDFSPPAADPDRIHFNIPGPGPQTIHLVDTLGSINLTRPVVLDGYTQPGAKENCLEVGSDAVIHIEIYTHQGDPVVKVEGTENVTVRGLALNHFVSSGVHVQTSQNVTIEGNFIGTDVTGSVGITGGVEGVRTVDAHNVMIGGPTPAARNVIAGATNGVTSAGGGTFDNARVDVEGNYIGVDASGIMRLNLVDGMGGSLTGTGVAGVTFARNNVIAGFEKGLHVSRVFDNKVGLRADGLPFGPAADGQALGNNIGLMADGTSSTASNPYGPRVAIGNAFSGNLVGIRLSGNRYIIQGNFIGTDHTATNDVGNAGNGISIELSATGNLIGGTAPGEGNVIAYNSTHGISSSTAASENSFLGNSIHSNDGLGISLNGGNGGQTYPTLSSAARVGSDFAVSGSLNSVPNRTFRIEFFSNVNPNSPFVGESQTYLDFDEVTTDEAGNAPISSILSNVNPTGHYITATATRLEDQGGDIVPTDTSEFSEFLFFNDNPVAEDDTYETLEDQALTGDVLGNDFDLDNDDLTVIEVNGSGTNVGQAVETAHGFVLVNADGTFTYTPGVGCEASSDSFNYTISDGHGGTSTATVTIGINQYSGVSSSGGVLRVGGTGAADVVTVGGGDLIVNGTPHSLAGVTEVRIWTREGNDQVDLTGLAIPAFVDGGQSNDTLTGGTGADVILGGDGDDTITGASGHDVLVGGDGRDRIVGSAGNDILVAGDVECGFNIEGLRELGEVWAASRTVTEEAIDDFLDETVVDGDYDVLTGSSGADLFIINSEDRITDYLFGKPNTNNDGDVVIRDGVVVT